MLAVFNILLGGAILFVGVFALNLFSSGTGGRWRWDYLIAACLPAAGLFHALGGAWMRSEPLVDSARGIRLFALASFFAIAFIIGTALFEAGWDRETLGFMAVFPGPIAVIAAAEVAFLALTGRCRKLPIAEGEGGGRGQDVAAGPKVIC
jgi:hypothetical protein